MREKDTETNGESKRDSLLQRLLGNKKANTRGHVWNPRAGLGGLGSPGLVAVAGPLRSRAGRARPLLATPENAPLL